MSICPHRYRMQSKSRGIIFFSDEEKMQNSAPTYLPQLLEDSRLKLLDEVLVHVEVAAALERGGEKLQSGDLDVEAQR